MSGLPAGRHFFQGSDGYESARRETVRNQRVPERYPANHLHDGAVLLDISRLDHAVIDADKRVAVVDAGEGGSVLAGDLDAVGLGFPDAADYLADHRYAADNMWTSASAEDLLPGIHRMLDTMPSHPSHFLWLNGGPSPPRQDMAYSVEDDIYRALYGAWQDPADDHEYGDWARSNMAAMAPLASGVQLADENLGQRPAKFASDAAMRRLDKVRAAYDPDGLFYSWMGRI